MRAQGAVVAVELPGGVAAWLVTRQETGRQVRADDRFTKDPASWGAWQGGDVPADWPPLARLEAAVALPALFARFPGLSLARGDPEPLSSLIFNSLSRLPVVLDGARPHA
ncbi:hypothetical protein [Streptomyces sp. NPDC017940]|uniref:hypothetical protein n=1 Tax=Streptomyces sp. NPDC017940 TaxID=3365017 RepID=UPI00379960E3